MPRNSKPVAEATQSAKPLASPAGLHTLRSSLAALAGLAVLVLAMFGDVLFSLGDTVLSNRDADLFLQFVPWRAFGFGELKHGNLALWNPRLFCGAPFFGGFQSALLYPLNALFLVLPLAQAINWSIALHVFLAGAFTYAWAARRRLHPLACFLSAAIFMFCGAQFLHIYAGHLPNLCSMVWAPLLFLAIDGLFEDLSPGWCLLGMFAGTMQVLAGHPQYVFQTGLAATLYGGLCCLKVRHRSRFLLGLVVIPVGIVGLSAVQLFTGLQEAHETVRSTGLSVEDAGVFSFPPENFMTLIAPGILGDMKSGTYWGRLFCWEASLFISVTGFVLAVTGALLGRRDARRFSFVMAAVLLLLALGRHTPLFGVLYHWLPGFDKFRGTSKFIFLASLFLSLLAGIGLDILQRGPLCFRKVVPVLALLSALIFIFGLRLQSFGTPAGGDSWRRLMLAVYEKGESYLPRAAYEDPNFTMAAAAFAAKSLLLGGGIMVLALVLVLVSRSYRCATVVLLGLAVGELLWFARGSLDRFALSDGIDREIKNSLAGRPGDYRILNLVNPNSALSTGLMDIWGSDPGIMRRYAELLAFSQGQNPSEASQFLKLSPESPLYAMLRCRFAFVPETGRVEIVEHTNVLPRLLLVSRCKVVPHRAELFTCLTNGTFDMRQEVLLETAPDPLPHLVADPGMVKLLDASTDQLTIEAEIKSPSILLITDSYAAGWRARPLAGSSQLRYDVLPANYCLRAIPLGAGRHRLCLEYSPMAFRIGKWVSLGLGFAFLVAALWLLARKRQLALSHLAQP